MAATVPATPAAPEPTAEQQAHAAAMAAATALAIQQQDVVNVGIDIETTGQMGQGECNAIGVWGGKLVLNADGSAACVQEVYSRRIVRELVSDKEMKAKRETQGLDLRAAWAAVWAERGWEQRCFDEFWGKPDNLVVLDKINQEPTHFSERSFAQAFLDMLTEVETQCARAPVIDPTTYQIVDAGSRMCYWFDTIHFDPVWCNQLLSVLKARAMNYYRNGRYGVDTKELDSYMSGLVRVPTNILDWRTHLSPLYSSLRAIANQFVEHDHNPINDAKHIVYMALFAHDVVVKADADGFFAGVNASRAAVVAASATV